ncbi:Arm DNA-binding domain-containing protein [Desulfonatronovibrio magnus]|uniref:Arm DNA-binding domain-containing protein n=1 Tax=Desulfonatronovibrio magnus TaxID=698827 RepID=UPI0006968DEE|nr:Arm DNA-binding domain-containing protein [Desulfonatronovibrio magnus]
MPKIHLTPNFVSNPPKPAGKAKVDYFDVEIPGFLLEVRVTGKSTYYQRYRDTSGRLKQFRIGPVDSVFLDDARNKAKKIRSQASMGLDPRKNLDRLKEIPTFKDFVNQKYLPFVQVQKRSWEADKRESWDRFFKLTFLPYFAKFLSTQQPQAFMEVQHAQNSQIYTGQSAQRIPYCFQNRPAGPSHQGQRQ